MARTKQTARQVTDGKAPQALLQGGGGITKAAAGAAATRSQTTKKAGERLEDTRRAKAAVAKAAAPSKAALKIKKSHLHTNAGKQLKRRELAEARLVEVIQHSLDQTKEGPAIDYCCICKVGGTLWICDIVGCVHAVCANCIPGLPAALAAAKEAGVKLPIFVCPHCYGPDNNYHGIHDRVTGATTGPPLRVVGHAWDRWLRQLLPRAVVILHVCLDQPELRDVGHPYELISLMLQGQFGANRVFSQVVPVNMGVANHRINPEDHQDTMAAVAQQIQAKFANIDYEIVMIYTTHTATDVGDESGALQVVSKNAKYPLGLSVSPDDFMSAVNGGSMAELIRDHRTTGFLLACGAVLLETPRKALLGAINKFNFDVFVTMTADFALPQNMAGFMVGWASEIIMKARAPELEIDRLVVMNSGFDRTGMGIAVYYGDVSWMSAQRQAQATEPRFLRYVWHSPPRVAYGEGMPGMCNACGIGRPWLNAGGYKTAEVICRGATCNGVHTVERPEGIMEVHGFADVASGTWMTYFI